MAILQQSPGFMLISPSASLLLSQVFSESASPISVVLRIKGFPGDVGAKDPPAKAGDVRDISSIPGLGRSPEKEIASCSNILA